MSKKTTPITPKKKSINSYILVLIICFTAFIVFYVGHTHGLYERKSSSTEAIKEPDREEKFTIQGNICANEVIADLRDKGWIVTEVKPMSAPSEFGYYDVLITYK